MVTDATCYMSWIADQYGLKLPRSYKIKKSCYTSSGDPYDVNKRDCKYEIKRVKRATRYLPIGPIEGLSVILRRPFPPIFQF